MLCWILFTAVGAVLFAVGAIVSMWVIPMMESYKKISKKSEKNA